MRVSPLSCCILASIIGFCSTPSLAQDGAVFSSAEPSDAFLYQLKTH